MSTVFEAVDVDGRPGGDTALRKSRVSGAFAKSAVTCTVPPVISTTDTSLVSGIVLPENVRPETLKVTPAMWLRSAPEDTTLFFCRIFTESWNGDASARRSP